MPSAMKLLPCPFCGAGARREDLDDAGNEGGSCIACTKCGASTAVFFDRKEHLYSSWNDRFGAREECDHPQINKATEGFDGWNICPDCGQTWRRQPATVLQN